MFWLCLGGKEDRMQKNLCYSKIPIGGMLKSLNLQLPL